MSALELSDFKTSAGPVEKLITTDDGINVHFANGDVIFTRDFGIGTVEPDKVRALASFIDCGRGNSKCLASYLAALELESGSEVLIPEPDDLLTDAEWEAEDTEEPNPPR